MPKATKRETLKSLRDQLEQERKVRSMTERDYRLMLAGRDCQIRDARNAIKNAFGTLAEAGRQFDVLRTSLSLIGTIAREGEARARHYAAAFTAAEACYPHETNGEAQAPRTDAADR